MRAKTLLLAGLTCLAVGLHAGLRESVTGAVQPAQELLRRAAAEATPASLALMVLVLGLMPFTIVVPMTATSVLAGALLPAALAPGVIWAGMLLNTLISWSLARTVVGRRFEHWVEKRGGTLGTLPAAAKRSPFKWSFFARFIPAPFALAPMVLASAGVSLGQVLGATAAAMLPWSFIYAWAGRQGREGSLGSIGLAFLGIVAFSSLAVWAYKRYLVPAEAKDARNLRAAKPVPKRPPSRPRKAKA